MKETFAEISRYISILDRLMKMYYDRGLADFEIGWGQQFYAEYIYDHPGTSAQEMVECIRVDKATLTKCVKKLAEIDYVRIVSDENDRRIKRLYPTDKATFAVKRIKEIHGCFYRDLCAGIAPEEMRLTEQILEHMTENINQKVWHRMEE